MPLCGWVGLGARGGLVSCWLLMYVLREFMETALPSSDSAIGFAMLCEPTQEAKSINNSKLTAQALFLWDAEAWPRQIPATHPHLGRQSKQPWADLSPAPCTELVRTAPPNKCGLVVLWQGNHKSNLPGIWMWRVLWWARNFGLKQWRRKRALPEVHRKTEGTCKRNSSVQGVKMSNGSAKRTAMHTKHIAFLRHLLLSHITSLSCWNSACPWDSERACQG